MIVIRLTDFEQSPGGTGYVDLDAAFRSSNFAGESRHLSLPESDLLQFAAELSALAKTSKGRASLVAGWGERECLNLTFQPKGVLGLIELHLIIRESGGAETFGAEGARLLEPQQLLEFSMALHRAVTSHERVDLELQF
jgi:hypothetical protein